MYAEAQALIMQDGRIVPMCPEGDWRGREWFQKHVQELSGPERWRYAMNFAAQVAALDLYFRETKQISLGDEESNEFLNTMTVEELVPLLHKETAEKLAAEYTWIAGQPYGEPKGNRLGQMARAYTHFQRCEVPPFAQGFASAYDPWRCYDLRSNGWGPLAPNDATIGVLVVDIHT